MKHPALIILSCILFVFSSNAQTKPKSASKPSAKSPAIRVIKPVSGGIVNGKATFLPQPIYPEDVRKLRITGMVSVRVLIDENGNVISAKAESGLDNLQLRAASEAAALQAKFSPTILSGKPVKVSGIIRYNYVEKVDYEKETMFVLAGMMFTLIQNFTADLDKLKTILEIKDFKSEFGGKREEVSDPFLNAIGKDVEQLATIEDLSISDRKILVDKIISSTKVKLSPSDLWQFQLGENFAAMMTEFIKVSNGEELDVSKLDENAINLSISKMKDLLLSAPPEFPAIVLQKFNEFANDSNKLDMKNPVTYSRFGTKLESLMETISPN